MTRLHPQGARHVVACTALALLAAVASGPAHAVAQEVPAHPAGHPARPATADTAAFLDEARRAAARYVDRADAMAEGYRQIGPDFPAMGEHWVQPGRLVSGRFEPSSPPVLSYIEVDGAPILVGVAYALPLPPDQAPPEFPWPGAWHDHTDTVDEESLLVAPGGHGHGHGRAPRLAMLHAWVGSENPDGVFAQHNWALPFRRAEIPLNGPPPEAAARALSLLGGGADYYTRLVVAAAPDAAEPGMVASAIEPVQAAVERLVAGRGPGPATARELEALASHWQDLLGRLSNALGPAAWQRVHGFLDGMGHH